MLNVREYAKLYTSKGWSVVPLTAKTKDCYAPNWQIIEFTSEDFGDDDNIGIKSLNGLVDLDLDSDETVALASHFLSPTGTIYGRKSKPRSHWLYKCPIPPQKTIAYTDLGAKEKATLIEIRVNHQSMAPPSIHPEGEEVFWDNELGEIKEIKFIELQKEVRLLATAAMITRYYAASGHRHLWILPLSGVLRHLGLSKDESIKCISFAAKQVEDTDLEDRERTIRSTYAKGDDDPIAAGKALIDLMLDGKPFLNTLKKIWGIEGKDYRGFYLNQNGRPSTTSQDNVMLALSKLNLTWYEDIFNHKLMINRKPLSDAIVDRLWLEIDKRFHFQSNFVFFQRVLFDAIRQKPVHPVREYLDKLKWDGKRRIDMWLINYGKAEDTIYTRAIGALVLIAAVRRVRKPGCKFDEMLILETKVQGRNKSLALQALVPVGWISEDLPLGAGAKQVIERTNGKWIIEAQELKGSSREPDKLKSFLSRQVDGPVRLAYGRLSTEVARQFVIIGTTNHSLYLIDPTGNRRFWPVKVKMFDIKKIKEDRDQIWAEASKREADGESIRLDPKLYSVAEIEQEKRRHEDPWESILGETFSEDKKWRLSTAELWNTLGIPIERRSLDFGKRLSEVMLILGFRKMSIRVKGERSKGKKSYFPIKGWGRDGKQPDLEEDSPF